MNLRTLSIGLSAAVLLGIVILLIDIGIDLLSVEDILFNTIILILCGFTPIISIIISTYSKSAISQILSTAASLFYGFFFMVMWSNVITGFNSGMIIFFVWMPILPILLPLWITACIVERWYRKKHRNTKTEP